MKILHVASEYPPAQVYGLGRFVHGLARAQAAQGHDVFVLTNSCGGSEDDVRREGVHLLRIAFPNPPRPPDGSGEVLQFNHGALARGLLAHSRGQLTELDLINAHDWLTVSAGRELADALGVPLVVTIHDEIHGKRFGLLDPPSRLTQALEARACQEADHVIANSEFVATQLQRDYGLPSHRLSAVPGGIDPNLLDVAVPNRVGDFKQALVDPSREALIGYVGRLDAEKGLETLAAAALLAAEQEDEAGVRLRWAIAGGGKLEAELRQRLAPLGRAVEFLGYVSGETLGYLYRSLDVLCVPSAYEPFGLVALEGLLAGTPVLAADAGGLREIVRDGLDGRLLPPSDPRAWSEALLDLATKPGLRRRLGDSGRARAEDGFAWGEISRRTTVVYERVLSTARSVSQPDLASAARAHPPEWPAVTALIVSHDATTHLEACLRTLLQRTDYPALRVEVVDDGSAPTSATGTLRLVSRLQLEGHQVGLRRLEGRPLRAAAAAWALEQLASSGEGATRDGDGDDSGRWVPTPLTLLLGDDVEIPSARPGWLQALVWLHRARQALAVSPVLVHRDGRLVSAGHDAQGDPLLARELDRGLLASEPVSVSQPAGACVLAESAVLAEAFAGAPSTRSALSQLVERERRAAESSERAARGTWRHPLRLLHAAGEATRDPEADLLAPAAPRLPASIVVVACGRLELTRKCLEALLQHTSPPYELILVDNASDDGTLSYFEHLRDQLGGALPVQVVANEENRGYPVAANQGLRLARGEAVVLLNNDTEVRPGWLEALRTSANARPGQAPVGIVTAKVLDLDGTVQSAGGVLHEPDGGFSIPFQGEDRLAPPVTRARDLQSAGGPCMLLTRALRERVGLFAPAYSPGYFEDSDLCLRARAAGLRLVYAPGAEVFHHGKATSSALDRAGRIDLAQVFARNQERFYGRWSSQLARDARQRAEEERRQALPELKLVLCYHQDPWTTARYLGEAFTQLGHEVITAGRGQDLDLGPEASASDLVRAAGGDVDLLLVVEGANYFPRGLSECPCPSAWWAIDTHLHARDAQGWHFARADAFDQVFVAQRAAVARFAARGIDAQWLPLACAPAHHWAGPKSLRRREVAFVGHVRPFHDRRRQLLERLAERFPLAVHEGVFGLDMAHLLGGALVGFNCSLAGDLNMRVFETLASGALLVTDPAAGLEELFASGEHLLVYDDEGSLEALIGRALAEPEWAGAIASRGQALALRHHTYVQRARQLLRSVRETPPLLAATSATSALPTLSRP